MKISSKNIIIFVIFSLLIFTTNSYGNTSSEFINNIAEKASKILSSKETNDLKIQQLTKIAKDSSDIDGIGLYMLGKHRKKLNEEQKNEYKEMVKVLKEQQENLQNESSEENVSLEEVSESENQESETNNDDSEASNS